MCVLGFQMSVQFHLWDRFRELGETSDSQRNNLAYYLSHLLVTRAMSLSVFKVRCSQVIFQVTNLDRIVFTQVCTVALHLKTTQCYIVIQVPLYLPEYISQVFP